MESEENVLSHVALEILFELQEFLATRLLNIQRTIYFKILRPKFEAH